MSKISIKIFLSCLLIYLTVFSTYNSIAGFTFKDTEMDIRDFGAKGDGVTDDYKAFLSAAKYINEKGGGTLVLSKGVYYIGAYHQLNDTTKDILFQNCNDLQIIGKNAVISVNGNFKRTIDRLKGKGHKFSKTNAIIPIYINNCKNVTIRGIEINGNVDKMTKDSGVVEGDGFLISIAQCENVFVTDVFVHHAQTDGIYIGGGGRPSKRVKMYHCISSNNARQGLSITYLYDAQFIGCKFLNTGFTEGDYGAHSPRAGVDIEPNKAFPKTSKIIFDSCYFENNKGSQFVCTSPRSTSNIVLRNCKLTAKNGTSRYQVILAADSVLMENCEMDLGPGNLWPVWKAAPGGSSTIKNCIIKSSAQGILCVETDDTVYIENNKLIYTGKGKMTSYFPYLGAKNLYFMNNEIFIPSSVMWRPVSSLVRKAIISKGNKFYSDNKNIKPKVSYEGTKEVQDH